MSRSLVDDRHIKIDRPFPTPVARLAHPQADRLNAVLRRTILKHEQQTPGVQRSNSGCDLDAVQLSTRSNRALSPYLRK